MQNLFFRMGSIRATTIFQNEVSECSAIFPAEANENSSNIGQNDVDGYCSYFLE